MLNIEELKRQRDALNKEKEEAKAASGYDDTIWYRSPSSTDKTVIRVLPEPDVNDRLGFTLMKHYNIKDHTSVLCMKTHYMDCPICQLLSEYETRLGEAIDQFKNSKSVYFNALVIEDNSADTIKNVGGVIDPARPVIWNTNDQTQKFLLDGILEYGVKLLDIQGGRNLIVQRKTVKGAFDRQWHLMESPINKDPEVVTKIMSKLTNFNKIWKKPDDKYYKENILAARDSLKSQLENLLMVSGNQAPGTPPPVPPVGNSSPNLTPPPIAQPPSSQMQTQSNSSIPAVSKAEKKNNYPECFGNPDVYNDADSKCLACYHEYDCSDIAKKKKV